MNPIATTASRPASICPVPAHLRPTIIYSGRRKRFTASRNPGLLRLMSGAYLRPVPGRQRWEQRFMVSLARAIAAHQLLPSATCLSHTSAALVQGLSMWTREPDVYLAVSGHPRLTTTTLPAFRYPASGVPVPVESASSEASPIRLHRRQLQLRDEEIEVVGGVPVTSVLRTAFDCACDEPPYNALSIADAALNRHCRPDPWHRDACATRLCSAHACWDTLITRHRGRRGIAQARAVLAAASPWAVSPGESVLRWMALVVGMPEAIASSRYRGYRRTGSWTWAGPSIMSSQSSTARPSTAPRRTSSSRNSARTSSRRWGGGSSGRRGRRSGICAPRPIGCSRNSRSRWSPISRRPLNFRAAGYGASGRQECSPHEVAVLEASFTVRRPHAPASRTYFSFGNCVVPQTTGGRHQSSAGHRSSRRESTFPILPYLTVRPADAGSGQNPARRRRRRTPRHPGTRPGPVHLMVDGTR